MLLVLFVHANYFSLGGVEPSDIQNNVFYSFVKSFAEQLCIICVNVFILISGWFGIRPSLKGAASLLFQVFFFHIFIVGSYYCIGNPIPLKTVLKVFYFGVSYWFVPAYLVLYAISPVLNSFIFNASPRSYVSVLLAFFTLEFALGWVGNFAHFGGGYSTISFIGLYLLAGFLRKHSGKMLEVSMCKNCLLYLLFTLIPVGMFLITGQNFGMLKYSSPFVVLSSAFFFLTFYKMRISSNTVNYIACSAFSIYLVHLHPLVYDHYKYLMTWAYDLLGGGLYILFVIVFALIFMIFCVLLDKLRILVWKWVCKIFLDSLLKKIEKMFDWAFNYIGSVSISGGVVKKS